MPAFRAFIAQGSALPHIVGEAFGLQQSPV